MVRSSLALVLLLSLANLSPGQEVNSLIAKIKAVGREGAGNPEAAQAWQELVGRGPEVLADVLAGRDLSRGLRGGARSCL